MGSHWSLLVSPSNGSNSVGSEHVSVSVNLSSLVLRETLSNVWINLAVRMDFMAGTHVFGRYFFFPAACLFEFIHCFRSVAPGKVLYLVPGRFV